MRANTRRLLLLATIVVLALGLAGLVTGAIGSAFLGRPAFLPTPHVELAAEDVTFTPVFALDNPFARCCGVKNTYISAALASLVLIGLFVGATRRMKLVPGRLQGVVEVAVEAMYNFVEGVAGPRLARSFFPIIATIFFFVAFNAWIALLPIYQMFWFMDTEGHLLFPLFRSAGTDLNMPLATAIVSFIFVEYWGLRELKWAYVAKFVRIGNLIRGRVLQGGIDLFVGVLEAFSEVVRIISFTFRLFGNMTAGETLLLVSGFLVSFVFTVPFYGLEILVGFVQALIFAGLTLAFAAAAITPHHEEHH